MYSHGEWPVRNKIPPALCPYYQYRTEFSVVDDVLMKGCRIVIPPPLQKEVIDFIHIGHQGIVKCRRRAQISVWWLGLSSQLDVLVKNCPNCMEERKYLKEPFLKEELPTRPMEKVSVDLCKVEKWFLVFTDSYSRYLEICELDKMTEDIIINKLKQIFSRFGICDKLRSDGGPQFKSKFKDFAKEYNFIHEVSSPHYQQSNGGAEAAVKIAKSLLKKNVDINSALLSYHTTPLDNGFTPAELMFGRKIKSHVPTLPANLNFPKESIQNEVIQKQNQRKIRQMEWYNKRHRTQDLSPLEIGASVWITDLRKYGKVVGLSKEPRSYLIKSNNKTYRRNRWHLIPAPYRNESNQDFERNYPCLVETDENIEKQPQQQQQLEDANENQNELFEAVNVEITSNDDELHECDDVTANNSIDPLQIRPDITPVRRNRKPPSWLNEYVRDFD